MTENEEEMLREIETLLHKNAKAFIDDDMPPEFSAQIVGTILSVVDAIFAIRDEQPWRGMTNPQEIARKLLRETGIGE